MVLRVSVMSPYPAVFITTVLALGIGHGGAPEPLRSEPARSRADSLWNRAASRDIIAENRRLMVRARVEGKTEAVVLIASAMGAAPRVAEAVVASGGTVRARFDDVGYLRVVMPLARFVELQRREDVVYALIDASYYPEALVDAEPDAEAPGTAGWAGPPQDTTRKKPPLPPEAFTADNPFVPMQDMRARDFQREHPTFDGRGVTIAVLEGRTIVDVQHPTLQHARTLAGERVPKIAGLIDPEAYEPREPLTDRVLGTGGPATFWAANQRINPTGPLVTGADGTLLLDGHRYTTPRPGTWYAGVYRSPPPPATPGQPAQPAQPSTPFGVLWNDRYDEVWVDTDRDYDFRDETVLRDLNVQFSTGRLWYDSTSSRPIRSRSFAVTFDSARSTVLLYEGTNMHSTMVASVSTGHNLGGGESHAAGYNARFIIVSCGSGVARYIESWVRAARDPRIDLITSSQLVIQFPDAGEGIQEIILARANRLYPKPMMRSAGNSGPEITSAYAAGLTPGFLAIGAAISQGSYAAHFGWTVPRADNVWVGSSRGPMLNGGFKPDVITPLHHVSATPCSSDNALAALERWTYPACHRLGGGTSSAAPTAAGATAALLSAARQTAGVATDGPRIRWAIRAGARFLDGYQVHEQGRGMLDLPRAWEALRRVGSRELPEMTAEGPVDHVLSRHLRTPGRGIGLYEREGWLVGDSGTRMLRVTRTTGPAGRISYGLRWLGNDGTFAAPATIALPLNQPVEIPVRIRPTSQGVHSAGLEIVDRTLDLPVEWIMTTIVAALPFTEANDYTIRRQISVPWPNPRIEFIRVPEGTQALAITVTVGAGRVALRLHDPTKEGEPPPRLLRETVEQFTAGQQATRLVTSPLPGTWGLVFHQCIAPANCVVYSDSTRYQAEAELTYTVRALGADAETLGEGALVRAEPITLPADTASPFTTSVSFRNRLAAMPRMELRAELGVHLERVGRTWPDSANPVVDVTVDSGTTSLRVRVRSDRIAGAELFLYDCTGPKCELWDARRRDALTQELVVLEPARGRWKAVLDGAGAEPAGTGYRLDVVRTGPQFGSATPGPWEASAAGGPGRAWVMARWRGQTRDTAWTPVLVSDVIDPATFAAWLAKPLATLPRKPPAPPPLGSVVTRLVPPARP